ncbi:DUF938 domain-containing protein [Cognatishimia sp. MH4019]|uniref:DUF938 domain-containing protein n=1 Tax=Cognatishimia sp. MH4019 TaxID=2854030 RepID=UPI001CD5A247|nr:DUF938 domain-containing protein [Cognatishimia sp. MH4019]
MTRLVSPSAARNAGPILAILERIAPPSGRALEIASGTGEHVLHFAHAMPEIDWQPSDVDPERLASIEDWARDHYGNNLLSPIALDATEPGWAMAHDPFDLVVLINLLHLISDTAAEAVLDGIAEALEDNGTALIYGPFLRNGQTTSDGDATFHAKIQADDAEAGYKDIEIITAYLQELDLAVTCQKMPANNIALIAQK